MNCPSSSWLVALAVLPCATAEPFQVPRTASAAQPAVLAAPVRLECNTGVIDSGADIAHSGPLFADLDGDRKPELLVGNFRGYFQLYADVGEPGAPKLVDKGRLKAGAEDAYVHNW